MDTSQRLTEGLDLGIELFSRGISGAMVVVVEDFVVVQLDGVHDGLEGINPGQLHVVVPAGEVQTGGVFWVHLHNPVFTNQKKALSLQDKTKRHGSHEGIVEDAVTR